MSDNKAGLLNQTVTQVLEGDNTEIIHACCQRFIASLHSPVEAAKRL